MNQVSLGHLANFNSAVPWGLWVAIYVWLVGISAGAFILVAWGNLKNNAGLKSVTRLGITLSLATLLAGLLSILIDLGHIERFYKLFTSPSPASVMAWMVWLYGVYFLLLAATFFWLKREVPKLFFRLSLLFALGIILIESLLFAMPPGRHWHSIIFVIHFFTASLASAIAGLIFFVSLSWTKDKKQELLKNLAAIALPIILVNLIAEVIEMIYLGGAGHLEKWFAPLSAVVAIVLLLSRNPALVTIAGCVELTHVLISKYDGLILAQLVEPYKGFSLAYIEPGLQFSYAPSFFELLVSSFLIGSVAVLFYILYKIFPLTREE